MLQRGNILSNIPPVSKNLLLLNIVFFLGTVTFQQTFQMDLTHFLGLYYIESEYFKPYQYISYMFMHGGIGHLFFNMFALWMFGRILEGMWGGKRFFIFYMVTGIGAALIHTLINWWNVESVREAAVAFLDSPSPEHFSRFLKGNLNYPSQYVKDLKDNWIMQSDNTFYAQQAIDVVRRVASGAANLPPTIGASGAVFGLLLAFGMIFPNEKLMLLFPPIPMKAKYFVIIYGIIELFAGVAGFSGDNIAHFAHLGGMIFGFVLLKIWGIKPYQGFM
ncbi:MAG: rhomboid family intramembrane serine protease [Bacteroidia bacterium]|nr:MAG: rhomboid family intramembrane serine protease [Bacteroidia bacterium]